MKENKKRNVGNGIWTGSAIARLIVLIYGNKSGNVSQCIALGIAFGCALGAFFDFVIRNKKELFVTINNR